MTDTKTDEIRNRISKAFDGFRQDVRALASEYSIEELNEVVSSYEADAADDTNPAQDLHAFFARKVMGEIGYRIAGDRAREVFAKGGTAYCVFHDGDMRECPPGSHT